MNPFYERVMRDVKEADKLAAKKLAAAKAKAKRDARTSKEKEADKKKRKLAQEKKRAQEIAQEKKRAQEVKSRKEKEKLFIEKEKEKEKELKPKIKSKSKSKLIEEKSFCLGVTNVDLHDRFHEAIEADDLTVDDVPERGNVEQTEMIANVYVDDIHELRNELLEEYMQSVDKILFRKIDNDDIGPAGTLSVRAAIKKRLAEKNRTERLP